MSTKKKKKVRPKGESKLRDFIFGDYLEVQINGEWTPCRYTFMVAGDGHHVNRLRPDKSEIFEDLLVDGDSLAHEFLMKP